MLKRSTLLLLTGAIALGGGVLLFENFQSRARDEAALNNRAQGDGERLFPFAEDTVESFVVIRANETLAFSKDETGTWTMNKPQQATAEEGTITFLLSQLTSSATRTLTLETQEELADFGLAEPTITVDLTAEGQPYQLMVGNRDFSGDKRYVRTLAKPISTDPATNPSTDTSTNTTNTTSPPNDITELLKIHVVPDSIFNAVNRPSSDWLRLEEKVDDSDSEAE